MRFKLILSCFFMLFCSHLYGDAQSLLNSLVFSSIDDEDYEQLERLVQAGSVDFTQVLTKNNETPLHYAAYLGKTEAVQILLNTKINVNALTPQNYSALHLAAQGGFTDIVQLLLEHGANQNIQNQDGFLPVHLAASFGKLDTTRLLIGSSGIVDMKGIDNVTPLQLAAQNGHNTVVLYLLSIGADPNFLASGSHGTALHFAVHGNHPDTVRLLLEHGALVNKTNDTGDTPFVWNGYIGSKEIANILLQAGADKSIVTLRYKYNALHTASIRGKAELIGYFISSGIFSGNEKSGSGSLGLHYASLYGHVDAMKVLIPITNINIQDIYGQTPLHYAISNNKIEAVKLLIQFHADTNIPNNDGETALDLAKRLGNTDIIQLL